MITLSKFDFYSANESNCYYSLIKLDFHLDRHIIKRPFHNTWSPFAGMYHVNCASPRCARESTAVHLQLHTHVGPGLISHYVYFCMHRSHAPGRSGVDAIGNLVIEWLCNLPRSLPPPHLTSTSVRIVRRAITTDLFDRYLSTRIADVAASSATFSTYVVAHRHAITLVMFATCLWR